MSETGRFRGAITAEEVIADAKQAKPFLVATGVISSNETEFRYPPLTHEGSDARYILEQQVGEHMVYVAAMAPHGKSTEHSHESPVLEHYFPVEGQLFVNGDPIPQKGMTVPSELVHQASTKDQGSLVVIFMEKGATKPPEKRHIPVDTH